MAKRPEDVARIVGGPVVVVSLHAYSRYVERHGGTRQDLRETLSLSEPAEETLLPFVCPHPGSTLYRLGPVGFVLNRPANGAYPIVATVLDLEPAMRRERLSALANTEVPRG